MGKELAYFSLVCSIVLFVIVSAVDANSRNLDEVVWQKRAIEAEKAAKAAYNPNPMEVANHLNHHVRL